MTPSKEIKMINLQKRKLTGALGKSTGLQECQDQRRAAVVRLAPESKMQQSQIYLPSTKS